MVNTPNLNLPKISGNSSADVVRDLNALADAVDVAAAKKTDLSTHMGDYVTHIPYVATTGPANVYAVTLVPASSYVDGMALAVKINVTNIGASTINVNSLGAKPIKKPNGNDVSVGQLKVGSIYTLRYNGTNFILQGEGASGNATASDLIFGKTASTDVGEISGTIADYSGQRVGGGDWINYEGDTEVDVYIPDAGYYSPDSAIILVESNLLPANIKKDVDILGVVGTFDAKQYKSGTIVHAANQTYLQVTGLGFLPKYIMLWADNNKLLVYNAELSTTTYYSRYTNTEYALDVNNYVRQGEFRLSKTYTTPSTENYKWIAFE
jgi:hypothetical protein